MSDQHARHITGCYGNDVIRTPNIDSIASNGARFESAYTPSPICVPARACFATGRYTHHIEYWDNAHPYDGAVRSWGHELIDRGHRVESIGKLHYRDEKDSDGFSAHHIPLNVVDGKGDPQSSLRSDIPVRSGNHNAIAAAGPGNSSYLQYDQAIANTACQWLDSASIANNDKPWVLFVSFTCPHPPYTAPSEHFDYYFSKKIDHSYRGKPDDWTDHPTFNELRRVLEIDTPFSEEETRRITAAYYGSVNAMDDRVGEVLQALDRNGFSESTRIVYTSDHGESLGQRGLYGKFTMLEDSAAIPLVVSGPDIPRNQVISTPVSLVDFHPTLLEMVTGETGACESDVDGKSINPLFTNEVNERSVISEYHAVASNNAWYLVRKGAYKLIYYVGFDSPIQLYDINDDPMEERDLANDPASSEIRNTMEAELRKFLDPEETDRRAKADQAKLIESYGGRDAVLGRGTFINSPAPGEDTSFVTEES
jgi:choline-sulfatase